MRHLDGPLWRAMTIMRCGSNPLRPVARIFERFSGFEQALQACEDDRPTARYGFDEFRAALVDFVDRNGVEKMQLRTPTLRGCHQIGRFQDHEMLRYGLARYVESFAQFVQALAVARAKPIQQPTSACVR